MADIFAEVFIASNVNLFGAMLKNIEPLRSSSAETACESAGCLFVHSLLSALAG
jgi:hypothetical protein